MAVSSINSSSALTQLYYGLSTDTKPAAGVQVFALFMETDHGNVFEYSGGQWTPIVSGGAAHITDGASGTIKDRYAVAPGNTQGVWFWPVGFGPKHIRLRLRDGSSGDIMKFLFDAPTIISTDNIATLWMADVGSPSTPRMHRNITNVDRADTNTVGDKGWSDWIPFTHPLRSLHYGGVGTLGANTVFELEGE